MKSLDEYLMGVISFALQKDATYQMRKQRLRHHLQPHRLLMIK